MKNFFYFSAMVITLSLASLKAFADIRPLDFNPGQDNHVFLSIQAPKDLYCVISDNVIHGHINQVSTNESQLPSHRPTDNDDMQPIYYLLFSDLAGSVFYGPDVKITYRCYQVIPNYVCDGSSCHADYSYSSSSPSYNSSDSQNYFITFEVAQPYSFMQGHMPTITVLDSAGLTLTDSLQSSAYHSPVTSSSPGYVDIVISKK